MEKLKQDLIDSWKSVKTLQEGSEVWQWHDKRIRYLIELLYGDKDDRRLSQDEREGLQEATERRRDTDE